MRKGTRAEKHAILLSRLTSVVAERQRDIEGLIEQRRRFSARAYAASAVKAQADALLALSTAVSHAFHGSSCSSSSNSSSSSAQQGIGGSTSAASSIKSQLEELSRIRQQLLEETTTSGDCSSSSGSVDESPTVLGWSPARAVEMAARLKVPLTTEGFRAQLRALVATSGCLLP